MSGEPASDGDFYYLVRTYDMSGGDPALIDAYFRDALIPAANRLGIKPIGAFSSWFGAGSLSGRVLILPSSDLAILADLDHHMKKDSAYLEAAEPYLAADPHRPPFRRMEASLLRAMPGLARMVVPDDLVDLPNRLFEIRYYEQPTLATHDRKADMFCEGEAEMLDASGLRGVMYGVDIVGERLPRLTYLWAYADLDARQKGEAAFFGNPQMRELFGQPRYANLPSVIHNTILRPTAYSQI